MRPSAGPETGIPCLFTLLKTFVDITVLRNGPETLPPSWIVFYAAVGSWLLGIAAVTAVVPGLTLADTVTDVAGWAISLALFAIVIAGTGYRERLLQGLAAIAGVGAIVLYAQTVVLAIFLPLGANAVAGLGLELLLIWAIFVKGRIIAATINVHALVGVAISVIVYILRFLASYALTPAG